MSCKECDRLTAALADARVDMKDRLIAVWEAYDCAVLDCIDAIERGQHRAGGVT